MKIKSLSQSSSLNIYQFIDQNKNSTTLKPPPRQDLMLSPSFNAIDADQSINTLK